MIVIGVTGGVGTGKSTVARMFERLGAVVIDADVIAHQLMEPKKLAWRQIVKTFGREILNDDETVNRKKLAAIVFKDAAQRKALEALLHPKVMRQIAYRLGELRRSKRIKAVVLDVPLLIEVGGQKLADALVVVTAPAEIQMKRLQKKYGWSKEDVHDRINAQWDLSAKAALADYVVDNGGSVDATRTQVKQLWKRLISPSKPSSTSRRLKR